MEHRCIETMFTESMGNIAVGPESSQILAANKQLIFKQMLTICTIVCRHENIFKRDETKAPLQNSTVNQTQTVFANY